MTDVSTWSSTDESNTSAPPAGFPEYMLPSMLNNSSRAVMGAVRRMYDNLNSGSQVLPYLPLAGGTVTGGTTFNAGVTTTSINATGNVSISGSITSVANVTCGGGISSNTLTANACYVSGSQVTIGNNGINYFGSNAIGFTWDGHVEVYVDRNLQGHIAIADGSNNISANGFYGTLYGTVAGGGSNVTTSGTVQGGYVTSTGNVNANGSITASGSISAGGIQWYNSGGYMRCDSALMTGGIVPNANNGPSCGLAGQAWAQVATYWLNNVSGRELKTDIAVPEPGALEQVLSLQPVKFRWAEGPFTDVVHRGFIADEVRDALGEQFGGYHRAEDGSESIEPLSLTAVLWQAVRELAAEVRELKGATQHV